MALGYENTGIGPKLIANAGNAMTESIRQFGEKLQKDIVAHNTDKQVVGFLSEAKNIDINSPTFQADLVGVLARYPMAAGDQRALTGARLLATGWEQKQAEKTAVTRFNERKTLAGMRSTGGGLYGEGPLGVGFNPDLPALPGEQEVGAGAGMRMGGAAGLGVPFNPQEQLAPTTGVVAEEGNPLFNTELHGALKQTGVDRRTGTRLMAQDAAAKAREIRSPTKPQTRQISGVGLVQYDPDTQEWNTVVEAGEKPGRWLNMGSHWENAETGVQKPISLSPAQKESTEIRKSAAETAKATKVTERALKNIDSEIDMVEKDISSVEKSIRDIRKKDRTPAEEAELAKWQEQHATLRANRDTLQKERSELGAVKKLDSDAAMELLKEAGGDREKARELARQRGYSL